MMDSFLCTEADVARIVASNNTYDSEDVSRRIPIYSARLVKILGFEFEPVFEVIRRYPSTASVNHRRGLLDLGKPILELVSVSRGGDALTIGVDVELYPETDGKPSSRLRLLDSDSSWYGEDDAPVAQDADHLISITAWTGYRERSSLDGWRATGDTVGSEGISSGSTPIEVAVIGTDSADSYGRSPIYATGSLLRINDEMFRVAKVIDPQHILLLRGQRGTSPVGHEAATVIQRWSPEPDVRHATALWTHKSYSADGTYATVRLDGVGATSFPVDAPGEVAQIIQQFLDRVK